MRLIDRYMPAYQFHETHSRRVAAPPGAILAWATAYRADSDRFFRFMIGLREVPARLLARRAAPKEPFSLDAFKLLERSEGEIVYGLIGRFWRLDYGLAPIVDGPSFLAFAQSDFAKLTLTFWTKPGPEGATVLVTETRVWCPNWSTRLKFTPYWLLIRPVSGLLRRRMLASTARDSERPPRFRSGGEAIAAGSPSALRSDPSSPGSAPRAGARPGRGVRRCG